jgi:hypothetical protein
MPPMGGKESGEHDEQVQVVVHRLGMGEDRNHLQAMSFLHYAKAS